MVVIRDRPEKRWESNKANIAGVCPLNAADFAKMIVAQAQDAKDCAELTQYL